MALGLKQLEQKAKCSILQFSFPSKGKIHTFFYKNKVYFFFFLEFMYLFEKERESEKEHEQGGEGWSPTPGS